MYFITNTGDKDMEMVREGNIVTSDLIVATINTQITGLSEQSNNVGK